MDLSDNADNTFCLLAYYGAQGQQPPAQPHHVYFARWVVIIIAIIIIILFASTSIQQQVHSIGNSGRTTWQPAALTVALKRI